VKKKKKSRFNRTKDDVTFWKKRTDKIDEEKGNTGGKITSPHGEKRTKKRQGASLSSSGRRKARGAK